jgi:hypothetical protein
MNGFGGFGFTQKDLNKPDTPVDPDSRRQGRAAQIAIDQKSCLIPACGGDRQVRGNCGFTFARFRTRDQNYIAGGKRPAHPQSAEERRVSVRNVRVLRQDSREAA